jgi:hypothetical protein
MALDSLYLAADGIAVTASTDDQVVAEVVENWLQDIRAIAERSTTEEDEGQLLGDIHHLAQYALAHDPFQELLDKVITKASVVYAHSWRRASLSLGQIRRHPRPSNREQDPYAVTASTNTRMDAAEIELNIYPLEFGPAAYAVIPLLFVHECVCHVPAQQDRNDNRSPFAEGFLDWVSIFFFEQWIALLDTELAPAARHHALQFSQILKGRRNPAWAARVRGHQAAETLTAWLQADMGRTLTEARVRVALLAVDLNQTSAPLAKKDLFISKLRWPFSQELKTMLVEWEVNDAPAAYLL